MSRVRVATKNDLQPGAAQRVLVDGVELLLCNAQGTLYAIEDVCTHDGAPLDQGRLEGCTIVCPRHGATFDVRSGEALTLPAIMPLCTYPVVVQGDDIFIET